MKLYYSKGACSLTPRIILNEINQPCEYVAVNLATKQIEAGDDYLAINPKGSVPALMLDQQELLTENAIILQYLADTFKQSTLLPAVGDFKRYRVLEWLNFVATELHKGFGPLFNPKMPQEVKDQIAIPNLNNKFKLVSDRLKPNAFLCGDHFTLPDAYLFVVLRWANHFKLESAAKFAEYFEMVKQRPAVHRSLQEEGLA